MLVVFIFFRQLEVCGGLVSRFPFFFSPLDGRHQVAHKLPVFFEGAPVGHRAMAGNDGLDAPDAGGGFHQRDGYSTPLPPLFVSMSGEFFPANRSPVCMVFRAGKTTIVSPPVWPRPK